MTVILDTGHRAQIKSVPSLTCMYIVFLLAVLLLSMYVYSRTSDCEQLTIASKCPPTPTFVRHASTYAISLQGVPWITGVGHCGFKDSTRATSLTICRSIRGWTTADSYRKE